MNNVYEMKGNTTETKFPENHVYTHARYKYYDSEGKVHYFITPHISMIDVPYRKYELI